MTSNSKIFGKKQPKLEDDDFTAAKRKYTEDVGDCEEEPWCEWKFNAIGKIFTPQGAI